MATLPSEPARTLLWKLGLHRPDLRAWALYDCANSAFWATVIQIFPIYFIGVASSGVPASVASQRFAWSTTIAMTLVALLSPVLGAMADYAGAKKKMLAGCLLVGIPPTAALYFVREGDWVFGASMFILGNIGVAASIVFYESFLPHLGRGEELDRVASGGFALGYLGSGLLMALNLWWIQDPHLFGIPDKSTAVRLSLLSAAVWWGLFSIPLFLKVKEPPRRLEADERQGQNLLKVAFGRLGETLRELRQYRNAFLLLLAFLIYNDGISTIIRMAAPYGKEMGLADGVLVGAILLVQFVAVPFAFVFAALAARIGSKRAILLSLVVYVVVALIAYSMTTATHFFVLAILVGTVQGGSQALSRSLFASLIPRHKSAEFFGFFGVFDKFAGIFGPALFATAVGTSGSSRTAILSLVVFFIVGGLILTRVDVAGGQRAAREAEERLLAGAGG